MRERRILRRYPNRRLYDLETSRYITLMDVRQLVLRRLDFVVLDSETGKDRTAEVLLLVLLERCRGGRKTPPRAVLERMVRAGR